MRSLVPKSSLNTTGAFTSNSLAQNVVASLSTALSAPCAALAVEDAEAAAAEAKSSMPTASPRCVKHASAFANLSWPLPMASHWLPFDGAASQLTKDTVLPTTAAHKPLATLTSWPLLRRSHNSLPPPCATAAKHSDNNTAPPSPTTQSSWGAVTPLTNMNGEVP